MTEPLNTEKRLMLRRMLTGFSAVLVVSLLISLAVSGQGAGALREIFMSPYGVFENITVVFFLAAALIALWRAYQAWLAARRWPRLISAGALLSGVFVIEELGLGEEENQQGDLSAGGLFGTIETWLFAPVPDDASIESIAIVSIVRLAALASIFWGFCALWYFRRFLKPVIAGARTNPSVPFWVLFALLGAINALMHFGVLPMGARFEEVIEMNAALAWLMAVCTMPVLPKEKVN